MPRRGSTVARSCSSADDASRHGQPPGGSPGATTTRVIIPRIDQPDVAERPTLTRSRVLTGYRPTRPLHVAHRAGNIENMLALQDDPTRECLFFIFIADRHKVAEMTLI